MSIQCSPSGDEAKATAPSSKGLAKIMTGYQTFYSLKEVAIKQGTIKGGENG
ncbi:MAG TPA: hypothetical protein V6D48_15830 [Oculatellaceae cyanobacterium]